MVWSGSCEICEFVDSNGETEKLKFKLIGLHAAVRVHVIWNLFETLKVNTFILL